MAGVKATIDLTPVRDSEDFLIRHIKLNSKSPSILVGRSSNKYKADRGSPGVANAFFDCPVVSRKHAELFLEGKELRLKDLNSLHGTSINGKRIHAPETVKSGDVISIGNNVADGAQSFNATVFKIDCKITETAPQEVVDLSSPATSPVLSAVKPSKPVVSTARVVWDEIEISPSPVVIPKVNTENSVETEEKRAKNGTYTVPDEDSNLEDDDVLDAVDSLCSSPRAAAVAPVKTILQSSVTEAELGEVADGTALDSDDESQLSDDGAVKPMEESPTATKNTKELKHLINSDIEDDEDSDFSSSDDSSESESYRSESPPSSELECSRNGSPVAPAKAPSKAFDTMPAPRGFEEFGAGLESQPKMIEKMGVPTDFDFNPFLECTPNEWKPHHGYAGNAFEARPPLPPFPSFAPPHLPFQPSGPPPPPRARSFNYSEPHPFYPVNGVPPGFETRGPWSYSAPMSHNNHTENGAYQPSNVWTEPLSSDTIAQQAKDKSEQQHAALLDRVAISSIVSQPNTDQAKDVRGTKRSATAISAPTQDMQTESSGTTASTDAKAGQTDDTVEPANKKLRLDIGNVQNKVKKPISKAKMAGTFALGAVAGSVAFMGALIALPDSVFF